MATMMTTGSPSAPAPADADTAVVNVTEALRINNMGSAAKWARLLAGAEPPDSRGLVLLAQHFGQSGNSGLIVAHLAPYAYRFPATDALHEALSQAHRSLKQRGMPAGLDAAAPAKQAIAPAEVEAVVRGINQALQMSDVESAVASARRLADMDPPDSRGLLLLAQCFLQTGRHTGLIVPHLAPYIHKFPADPSLHWMLSISYHSTGQRTKAAEHAHIVVEQKPHWAHAQFALGHHYYRAGSPAKAVPFLRKAAQLQPDDFETNHSLSLCLAETGVLEEALAFNRCARALDPAHEAARRHGDGLEERIRALPGSVA